MQAIATAQASVDDGCNLELLGIVQAGNDSSFCNVLAATVDNSTATNATVDLISEVVAVTGCFGNVSNVTNVTGQVCPALRRSPRPAAPAFLLLL